MLRYFPNILPDELLYSALGRCSKKIGGEPFKPIVNDAFGTHDVIAAWEFPSHLDDLVKNLGTGNCYGSEELIFANTMLPLYYPFLDKERQQYALEHMRGQNGKGIHMKLGVMASKVKVLYSLKFCPICISEDIEQYKTAYWHRSHNVAGTQICHKHAILLRDNCPVCGVILAPKSKNEFVTLEKRCPNGHTLTLALKDSSDYSKELEIAKAVNYLLNSDLTSYDSMFVQKAYRKLLSRKELITPKGTISEAELIQQFQLYYDDKFLQKLGLDIQTKSGESWLAGLLRRPEKVSHPLKHILLINFLVGDITLFFKQTELEYHPFGKSPWLCLNPAADHYGKPVVTKCDVTRCTDTKKPVGTFECECGFIYSRRGPDTCEEDKFKVGRIKAFGTVWEDKLKILSKEDMSLRAIAREMKADTNTVKKYLEKLRIVENDYSSESSKTVCSTMLRDELSNLYADNILKYINENEQATRTMVRSKFQKEYSWLYRHNKELLFSVLPKLRALEESKAPTRVDWEKRDIEIAEMSKKEIQRLLRVDKPERITPSRIGKNLCKLSMIERHIDKLPKTKRLLDELTETIEDFQIRRAKAIIEHMLTHNEPIKLWVVLRQAGLGVKCSDKVRWKIVKIIDEMTNKDDVVLRKEHF